MALMEQKLLQDLKIPNQETFRKDLDFRYFNIVLSFNMVQAEFELSNTQDGIISSMFMAGMSIAIPICSESVYHVNAFRLAGVSLLIWSIATVLCGFSFDFYSLAFCRMFVGVGEAAIISFAPPYIGLSPCIQMPKYL